MHYVSLDFLREQKGCSIYPGAASPKLEVNGEQAKALGICYGQMRLT